MNRFNNQFVGHHVILVFLCYGTRQLKSIKFSLHLKLYQNLYNLIFSIVSHGHSLIWTKWMNFKLTNITSIDTLYLKISLCMASSHFFLSFLPFLVPLFLNFQSTFHNKHLTLYSPHSEFGNLANSKLLISLIILSFHGKNTMNFSQFFHSSWYSSFEYLLNVLIFSTIFECSSQCSLQMHPLLFLWSRILQCCLWLCRLIFF